MNVGAIGAYKPISYISPYATATASNANTIAANTTVATLNGNVSPSSDITKIGQNAGKKIDKTDPTYECQTCENRKYQDGSDEHDVSFKNASKIAPEAAASAVRNHEQMHVKNAYEKAEKDNGKVISASVAIHTSICPECGKTYISGGTTRTMIKYSNEENPYQKNLKNLQAGLLRGINLDMRA